jgi:hypothetical protein
VNALSSPTYIGGGHLLEVGEDQFGIFSCKTKDSGLGSLSCENVVSGASADLFGGKAGSLAYIEADKIIQYDASSGVFTVNRVSKRGMCNDQGCDFQTTAVMTGNLGDFCEDVGSPADRDAYQVISAGVDQALITCKGKDSFVTITMFPTASSQNSFSAQVARSGKISTTNRLVSLGGSLVLSYSSSSPEFNVYDCKSESCKSLSSGNFTDDLCNYASKTDCVADTKCGFCVDSGKCMLAGADSPCTGSCSQWVSSSGIQATPDNEVGVEDRQVVYVDEDVFLRYIPSTGAYEMYLEVFNHPSHSGKCPSIAPSPLYRGTLSYRFHVASQLEARSVLFTDPATGNYAVWRCQPFSFEKHIGNAAPCATVATGTYAQFKGVHKVMTFGKLTLTYNDNTGALLIHNNTLRQADGSEDQSAAGLFDSVVATRSMPELKGHKLFGFGGSNIFEHVATTGEYRMWHLDDHSKKLIGPSAQGQVPHQKFLRFAWIGEDRMLAVSDDGKYMSLRLALTSQVGSAIPISTVGRGTLGEKLCDYSTCEECGADDQCGWCQSSGRCMPGNDLEPCSDGSSSRCLSWMKGYCSATSCLARIFRSDCIEDGHCGWCEASGLCVAQKDGKAVRGAECPDDKLTVDSRTFTGDKRQ